MRAIKVFAHLGYSLKTSLDEAFLVLMQSMETKKSRADFLYLLLHFLKHLLHYFTDSWNCYNT
jgi:hypothetical protein